MERFGDSRILRYLRGAQRRVSRKQLESVIVLTMVGENGMLNVEHPKGRSIYPVTATIFDRLIS